MRAAALALALVLASGPAAGQQPCARHEVVVERLAQIHGETLQSAGLTTGDTAIVEVYASEETGSWTILIVLPNGIACLIAAGQMWDASPAGRPKGEPL